MGGRVPVSSNRPFDPSSLDYYMLYRGVMSGVFFCRVFKIIMSTVKMFKCDTKFWVASEHFSVFVADVHMGAKLSHGQ